MLSCWHDLLFLFCILLFYLFLSSMGWLWGVGVFGLIECPHSLPALHSGLHNNNNNNNNNNNTPYQPKYPWPHNTKKEDKVKTVDDKYNERESGFDQ